MTDRLAPSVRSTARRVRYALAAITVFATLLAISAFYKSATCTCDGPGVPYTAIGVCAAALAAAAAVIYAALGTAVARATEEK